MLESQQETKEPKDSFLICLGLQFSPVSRAELVFKSLEILFLLC